VLRSFKRALPSRIPDHNLVSISDLHHAFYMSLPLRPRSLFVLVIFRKFLIIIFLSTFCHFPHPLVLIVLFSDTLNFSSTLKFRGTFHTPYDRSNYTSAYCNFSFLLGKLREISSWMLLPRELQYMFRLRTRVLGCEHARSKMQILSIASHRFCYADVYISTQQIPWWQTVASNISDLEIQVHSTRGINLFYITDVL